jgi:hypothetical protein
MKQIFKIAKYAIFTATCFATTALSAWYDPSGQWGHRFPNRWDIPSRGKYTLRADLLLLRPRLSNLQVNENAFAGTNLLPAGSTFTFINNKKIRHFNWDDAWKIGFGYACGNCWEANLNWTHYITKAQMSDLLGAETRWKLDLEIIDLEVGKTFWLTRCLYVKPYLCIRAARINQRYRFKIPRVLLDIPASGTLIFSYGGTLRNTYLAGGPRIGFDSQWNLGCGFNIYLTAAGSWLYGERQNRFRDFLFARERDTDRSNAHAAIADFSVGLGWSDLWYNETRRLTFRFGYEHHYFYQETGFPAEGLVVNARNKSWYIQGIAGSIIVDF